LLPGGDRGNLDNEDIAISFAADLLAPEGVALASLAKVAENFVLGILAEPDTAAVELNVTALGGLVFELNVLKFTVKKVVVLDFLFVRGRCDVLHILFPP